MTSNIIIDDSDQTLSYMINNYKGLNSKRELTQLKKRLGPGILNNLSSDNFNDFYPTPPECLLTNDVKQIIKDARYILEPSAGIGSMIYTAYQINKKADITAFELMRDFSEFLNIKFPQLDIYNDNFLNTDISFLNKIDTVLCNPPFTYGNDKRFYLNFFFKSLYVLANSSKQYTSGGHMVFFCPSEGLEGFIVNNAKFGETLNYSQIIHSKYMTLKKVIEIYDNCNVEYNEKELKQFIQLGKKQNRTTYENETYLDLYDRSLFFIIEPTRIIKSEGCKFGTTGAKVDKYVIYMPYEAASMNEPMRRQQEEVIDNKKDGVIIGKVEDTRGREAKIPQKEIDIEKGERNQNYLCGVDDPEMEKEFEQGLKEIERLNKLIDDESTRVRKGVEDIKKRHTKGYKPEPEPEPETYSEPEPEPETYPEPEQEKQYPVIRGISNKQLNDINKYIENKKIQTNIIYNMPPKGKKTPNTGTKILHLDVSRCQTQMNRKYTPSDVYAYEVADANNENQFRKLVFVSPADGEKYYNTSVFFKGIPSDNQIIKYVDNIKLWDKIKITKSNATYNVSSGQCEGEKGLSKGPIERTIILKDKKNNSIEKNLDTNIIYNMPPKGVSADELLKLGKDLGFKCAPEREIVRKTTAKKTTARKTPAKKTVAKKTEAKKTTQPKIQIPAGIKKEWAQRIARAKKTVAKKTAKPKVKKISPSRGKWNPALKEWNKGKDKWCTPKKNSKEYFDVITIAQRMYNASKKN